MDILVLSARALAALRPLPEGCAAVICCQTLPELSRHPGLQVLHIPFGDVTDPARPDAFREAYGRRIREFADRVPARRLYCCCDSGESRSAAVAAALSRYLGRDETAFWLEPKLHPNPLVYRLLCRACGLKASRLRTAWLQHRNRQAFRNAKKG